MFEIYDSNTTLLFFLRQKNIKVAFTNFTSITLLKNIKYLKL